MPKINNIFKNLSITKKFALGFGIIFVVLIAFLFITFFAYVTIGKIAEKEAKVNQRADTAFLLENSTLRINLLLHQYTDVYNQSILIDLNKYRSLILQYSAELRKLNPSPAVIVAIDSFEATRPPIIAMADNMISLINRKAPLEKVEALRREREVLTNESISYLKHIVEIGKEEQIKTIESGKELRAGLARNIIVIVLLILSIIVAVSFWIIRSITVPVRLLVAMTQQIAEGNFEGKITMESRDELGQLAQSFSNMAVKLKESYTNLDAANQQLKASNQQLRASNQQLDASTQQLRAANQQLVASETGLKEKIRQLEVFNKATVGRELKMAELKKENEKLRNQSKQP